MVHITGKASLAPADTKRIDQLQVSPSHGDRVTHTRRLFWRALLAFIALPAMVAGLIPWLLAPWSPPITLVTVGLYRVSRNPMYLAVVLVLIGWAVAFGSPGLTLYATVVALAFHLRVVTYEEPWLARTFGAAWIAYRSRVPRWFGRVGSGRDAHPGAAG